MRAVRNLKEAWQSKLMNYFIIMTDHTKPSARLLKEDKARNMKYQEVEFNK